MDIRNKIMLSHLTIRMWSGRKFDRKVTSQVNELNESYDSGNFNKLLVSKDSLSPLQKISSQLRSVHYDFTLPYEDGGNRILTTEIYFDYIKIHNDIKSRWNDEVDRFCKNYIDTIDEARTRLGKMFDENDYPSIDSVKERFGVQLNITPFPSSDDFRIKLTDEEVEHIKKTTEDSINKKVDESVMELFQRIYSSLQRMADTLYSDKIFRDSLVSNIREVIDLAPKLNFTDNENINELVSETKKLLIDPDSLRKDESLKMFIADETTRTLNKFKSKMQDYGL